MGDSNASVPVAPLSVYTARSASQRTVFTAIGFRIKVSAFCRPIQNNPVILNGVKNPAQYVQTSDFSLHSRNSSSLRLE